MQIRDQIVSTEAERYILIYVLGILVILITLIIVFFVVFQKRKNQLLLDKIKQQQQFDDELIKTQQEIQEETLKHVGRELHDNIGQLLAFSSMQMKSVSKIVSEEVKIKVDNAAEHLKESLFAVRALSKSLNTDIMGTLGFGAIVENEINRLNKTGLIKAKLEVEGEVVLFKSKKDIVMLFRILQEFFSNTLKYSNAEQLNVMLHYQNDAITVEVKDNGNGFDLTNAKKGSGLINMEKRAELINATFNLKSKPNDGTVLKITYPFREA